MEQDLELAVHILASLAVGLLIGIERGWSKGDDEEGDRVAGIRTFSIVGLLGGVSAKLSDTVGDWLIAVMLASVAVLIIASYMVETRKSDDIGTTTAFSMILTFVLAVWAAFGFYLYALGVTAVVVMLLGLKPILHEWVSNIETKELYAGIKLLIISVVLLPLLPDQGYGPWEVINPYWLWWMVVLICGISFVGYFSIKYTGGNMGTLLMSVTGGLVSSTAVTLSMAQFARSQVKKTLFMAGVLVSSSVMFVRIMLEVSIVNATLLQPLLIPMTVMFMGVLVGGAWLWYQRDLEETGPPLELKNPFKLTTALKFGLLLAVILLLAAWMQEQFGDGGIYILSVISGLAKVDAIVLSLSRMASAGLNEEVAVMGIILASATSTLLKGFIFAFFVGMKESMKLIGLLSLAVLAGLCTAFFLAL